MAVVRDFALLLLLLLFGVCFRSTLASDGLNESFRDFSGGHLRHRQRSLLQATPATPPTATPPTIATPPPATATPPPATATPPPATTTPPPSTTTSPTTAPPPATAPATPPAATTPTVAPRIAPILPPSPPPRAPPAPATPVRVYLMWIGIGAFILVLGTVAVIYLVRKFGQNQIRRGQRLPPLPRYH